MLPAEIATRAAAVRLDKKELAALAQVSHKQVVQITRGTASPRLNTLQAIEAAMLAEELRLRDYLIGLHGLPRNGSGSEPIPAEGGAA